MNAERVDITGQVLRKGESRRKDGRYHFAYTQLNGKRCYIYASNLDELRHKENLYYFTKPGDSAYYDENVTLNTMYERALSLKFGIKPSTYASYRQSYDNHIKEALGNRKIKSFRYSDILEFYSRLVKKGLSIKTVKHIHTQLASAFTLAYRDQIIPTNPVEGAYDVIKNITDNRGRILRALTEEEQRIFLEFINGHPVYGRYHSIFVVMLGTGLRVGELCGLRWQDVDLENRLIDINHGLVRVKAIKGVRKEHFRITTTKTEAGKRRIPIMKPVVDAFAEEYELARSRKYKSVTVDDYTGFVFTNENGNVYSAIRLDLALKCIVNAYNKEEEKRAEKEERNPVLLPHISNHMLRHTFCSRLCERDTNLKIIQTLMGHANINITLQIYAEVTKEKQQEVVDKLADEIDFF